MDTTIKEKILKIRNLTKKFPGLIAVNNVSFDLFKGEIHGLLGENGAGKSTLLKMLDGSYSPDEGEIFVNGQKIELNSPQEAIKKGISMVYQELMLLPHLSVAENICFPLLIASKNNKINWKELYDIASTQLKRLDVKNVDVKEKVNNLSVAHQQIVSIARALVLNCQLLILDEPTSALSRKDILRLFKIMKLLKKEDVSIIFVSHRLNEVLEITDRITVLRDSRKIGTFNVSDLSEEKITELIVGQEIKNKYPKICSKISDEEILRVENLNVKNKLFDISFSLKKGEVLGVAGALGAGKSELVLTLFGAYKVALTRGKIFLENEEVLMLSPSEAMRRGFALVSEDRRGEGLLINCGIRFNISLPILRNISSFCGYVDGRKERAITEDFIEKLHIKHTSMEQKVENLSGGNQQKTVLAKCLASKPKVIFMDEPTRGIDVGAKVEIYELINTLTKNGVGVILFSSEVPEIIGMSDRIIVLNRGRIIKEVARDQTREYEIQRLVLSEGEKNNGRFEREK